MKRLDTSDTLIEEPTRLPAVATPRSDRLAKFLVFVVVVVQPLAFILSFGCFRKHQEAAILEANEKYITFQARLEYEKQRAKDDYRKGLPFHHEP